MNTTLSFLFGREIAYRMALLEQGLLAINRRHTAYFAAIPSKFIAATGEAQPASLAEFVQPHWCAGQPSLAISPDLPPAIVAECLACVAQVMATSVPPRPARKWAPLFRTNRMKVPQLA